MNQWTKTKECAACGGAVTVTYEEAPHPSDCWPCRTGHDHYVRQPRLAPHECEPVTSWWVDVPGTIEEAAKSAHARWLG